MWLASGLLGSMLMSCDGGGGGGWKNWLCGGDGGWYCGMLLNYGGGGGYECVVGAGLCYLGAAFEPTVALVSAPAGEGYRWSTAIL
jgi:hypothetical protein